MSKYVTHRLRQYPILMSLKMNYSNHIKSAPNPNQGVGGQDEDVVSEAQLDLQKKWLTSWAFTS